ncbi:MAG: murein hydrolase activator EnvC family protein [Burkholderiales bacterium]
MITCVGVVVPAPGHASAEADLEKLQRRIHALQNELEKAEANKSEATDALKKSEQAISQVNRSLRETGQKRREIAQSLGQLKQRGGDVDTRIDGQQALLGEILYRQYLAGRQDYLRVLLDNRDPNQALRDLRYYAYISRERADLLEDLRSDLAQLKTLTRTVEQEHAALQAIESRYHSERKLLLAHQSERKRLLAKLADKIHVQRSMIGRLQRDEARLTNLVKRLAEMLVPESVNAKLPDSSVAGIPFQSLKGKLRLPVLGQIANRFGQPREDGGTTWKGLMIRAKDGAEVKAVASGRVVFADWLRGFGNLLIVDHGEGYMSLYGNNEALFRGVGDNVGAGETVASVGNSGGNPDSGLYFEVRHRSKPLDPLSWVSLK